MNNVNNSFKIIGSFAPVSVKNQLNKNHIVASIIRYTKDIDFNQLEELSNLLSTKTSFFVNQKYIILNIGITFEINTKISHDTINFKVLEINIFTLLNYFSEDIKTLSKQNKSNKSLPLYSELEFTYYLKVIIQRRFLKDDTLYKNNLSDYNVIFIFNNITWSNIVYMFYANNLIIYGGSATKRHLLSTVQANLAGFLYLINNMNINNSLIHQSFTDKSSANAKIDKLIETIKKSKEDVLSDLLKNESISNNKNFNYFFLWNVIIYVYTSIMSSKTDIDSLSSKIKKINLNILHNKERTIKYSKLTDNWGKKKISNINKSNATDIADIKDTNLLIEKKLVEINKNIDYLYQINKDLFDNEGKLKLNPDIKKFDLENKKATPAPSPSLPSDGA
jgi:hypothetical protein